MTYDSSISSIVMALGDPTRRAVVERLASKPMPVGEIAATLPVSRPAVSQHLKVLSDAGLVAATQSGTRRIYALNPNAIAALSDWCDHLWDDALCAFQSEANRLAARKGPPK